MDERPEVVEIDLSAVATADELQLLLMDRLGFPGWYGCNWNAFWDAITGLVAMPRRLRLAGWSGFAARLPDDARLMRKCLDDMAAQYPEATAWLEYAELAAAPDAGRILAVRFNTISGRPAPGILGGMWKRKPLERRADDDALRRKARQPTWRGSLAIALAFGTATLLVNSCGLSAALPIRGGVVAIDRQPSRGRWEFKLLGAGLVVALALPIVHFARRRFAAAEPLSKASICIACHVVGQPGVPCCGSCGAEVEPLEDWDWVDPPAAP